MRNDLGRACARCGLRAPNTFEKCPSCGGALGDVRAALKNETGFRRAFSGVHPVRDLLLFVPALLIVIVSAISAIALAVVSIPTSPPNVSGGGSVAFAAVSVIAGYIGFGVIGAMFWAPWALLVGIVSFAVNFRRRQLVRVLPFQPDEPPSRTHLFSFVFPLKIFFEHHRWRIAAATIAGVLLLELGAEIFSAKPFWLGQSLTKSLEILGISLLAQVLFGAMMFIPLRYVLFSTHFVLERLDRLESALHHHRVISSASDVADARKEASEGRESARGRAAAVEADLVAPLSGERCLAFRLVGRIGALEIDDAEMTSLALEHEGRQVVVRAKTAIVALDAPDRDVERLTTDQRERVRAFLEQRGITIGLDDVDLGETLLRDGDSVEVFGAATEERVAEGYRDACVRMVIDDSDGEPLLLGRAT